MKEKVQVFGRFLSGMVMPNIGAFIAWGFITALFIPTGWMPNETLNQLVTPMSTTLLTLLIAFTGGAAVAGHRGGVVGAIATMGVITGSDIPMFIGAMIMGPLGGFIIKKFDGFISGRIKEGFEMLVNNFSVGIIGAVLAILGLEAINPIVTTLNNFMAAGVGIFVNHGLLPLASIFVEPAKVLFLNNAVNHGILSPMGMDQVKDIGKSILFLVEANPGPGLGVLIAYCIAGKGAAKSSAPGAIIIHFLGGIHEIYFPYIMMNPVLLIAVIFGGMSGIFTLTLFNGGLVAPASPGSIIAVLAMTPKGGYFAVIAGVLVAATVSCLISLPLLKIFGKGQEDIDSATQKVKGMKAESKGIALGRTITAGSIKKIVFACDAGMGSSAMGATVLRKKIKEAGIEGIEVVHASVSEIPKDAQVVVTHEQLAERAAHSNPDAKLVLIKNFMNAPQYDELVKELKSGAVTV
ncbi:MAG: PTS mannitol transporter subunit IICBA [Clostridium sp.]|nr:PTS mannitol transporter subunit IICBA [Clostridium sp.]